MREARSTTAPRFFFYDSTLYRDRDDTLPNEAWIGGEWRRIIPSEQDYNGMREVFPAYGDGTPLDLGRHGTLDPSEAGVISGGTALFRD